MLVYELECRNVHQTSAISSIFSQEAQKRPVPYGTDPYTSLAASYSHRGRPPTTIGAEELNFRVRYGNGCDLFAIATKPDGENVLSKLDNNVQTSH